MANLTSTISLVTRTRSTRAPTHLSKPPPSTTLNSIRGTTPAAPPPQPSASLPAVASPSAISNVSLFLTNLRLLDLDLSPDWPDISPSTFNTKDAGGQKKRVQCVEWALYHLFALYDRDETRNKLLPFFPPNDQVQSLNLRAALLRQLEQAKKNGVLGRDAVVRKTMLDECKGERLEEVLAVFSSAVLKKVVAERQLNSRDPIPPALAQRLALENMGYSGDKGELTVLVLAHRVSLQRTLDERNKLKERFDELAGLLAEKEGDIVRRRRQQQDQEEDEQGVPEQARRDVWRTLRNNWTGSERWMETLLRGDSEAQKDGVLSAPFDRVWRRVQSDRLAELDEKEPGLLEQLDVRVRSQKERLEKWQGFRQRMFGKAAPESAKPQAGVQERQSGIDLGFRGHETLHIGRANSKKLASTKPSNFDHEYEKLILNLKAELDSIAPTAPRIPSFFQQAPTEVPPLDLDGVIESESEEISDISDHEPTPIAARPSPPHRNPIKLEPVFEPVLRKAQSFYNDEIDFNEIPTTPSRHTLRRSATIQSNTPSPRRREPTQTPTPTQSPRRRLSSPPKPVLTPTRNTVLPAPQLSPELLPSPEEFAPSPTQEMADQILASVNNASPSPIKRNRHTLSLAERTRLSMARRTSHANLRVSAEDDDLLLDSPAPEPQKQPQPPTIVPTPPSPLTGSNGYEDLVSRTRRSMANFEAVKQKAQIERRRSLRQAKAAPATPQNQGGRPRSGYFSSLDEEGEDYQDEGNTTLLIAEELINEGKEDDYEAVFMSRPKIATSPIGTPVMRGRNWATTDF
ncbi:HAUS augmin-like complex subunit 6 N-terminus-domain-containing protein [Triangularia verruculosa]|uniref:HAUS augmin-like complex subunit 6 N-terminus-domain-containing protein n=1 Tax=Triangularia verruculosa TaxID=2587418 RepID=A0AAN6XI52_9PEZI|nr:HAUS augmin-like complex subunit 6 N-terminus-domain-containing protein [Triangularia verruculosa]